METLQDSKATPDEKNINSMKLSYKIAENKLCQDLKWYAISKLKFTHWFIQQGPQPSIW